MNVRLFAGNEKRLAREWQFSESESEMRMMDARAVDWSVDDCQRRRRWRLVVQMNVLDGYCTNK